MPKTLYTRHNEVFLALLRSSREARRLRQSDLAERLGSKQAMVSKAERGERRLDVIELRDWLQALDLDFVAFVRDLESALTFPATAPVRPRAAGTRRQRP